MLEIKCFPSSPLPAMAMLATGSSIPRSDSGAFHLDADLFRKGLLVVMVEPVADPSSNIFDNADKLDAVAFPLEPGASFISGVCWKEGPVGGDDLRR